VTFAGDSRDEDHELVATEPCKHVLRPERPAQALRDSDQQPIADGVAERVVDHLEVVEVDEYDGHPPLRRRGIQRRLQPPAELLAVRQTGEPVMIRLVPESSLRVLALCPVMLGHVPPNDVQDRHGRDEDGMDRGPHPRGGDRARMIEDRFWMEDADDAVVDDYVHERESVRRPVLI
jgi:hypothetical protein